MRGVRLGISALGELFITVGLLILLFVVWQLWWTDVTSNSEQASAVSSLERGFGPAGLPERGNPAPPTRPLATAAPRVATVPPVVTLKSVPLGQAFGIMRIPRFGSDYARPVLQGTDHDTLIKGIGHYAGTAFPGQVGNFAVAGHRTTYGKPFANVELLRKGDLIVVETKASYFVYAVDRHVIVTPIHLEVIAPVPQHKGAQPTQAWMTMTACHPRFSASHRYVVFSKLVKRLPRASGLPASFLAVPAGLGG